MIASPTTNTTTNNIDTDMIKIPISVTKSDVEKSNKGYPRRL